MYHYNKLFLPCSTHLHAFPVEVHLDQRVSYKMSEAAAVEVAVWTGVVLAVVDLRELQTSIFIELLPVEVLMGAEDLHGEETNIGNETQETLAVTVL